MFKGFDPVSFLSGLCGHFRDLLMAKTEATVKLLDVSDGIRKRYILQSREMPEGFLMSGLNIAATIEANIKTARSPRLQVELALMKMAFLTQVIDLAQVADEKKKPESVVVAPGQPASPASDSSMSPAQSPAKPIVAAPVAEPNLSLLKGGVQAIRGLSKELQEAKEKEQQRIASANSIPLSAEEFAQQWPHIIREANNAGDLFLKAILESGDAKMQGGQIHLIVRSKVEESKIQDSESWLAAHFRTYFGVRQPAVMMQMAEASPDAPVIMGTGAKSKFARMAEINPNIVALKEALDLEFVY
jgi:DNA polymerase-3 subunit gamma/tau